MKDLIEVLNKIVDFLYQEKRKEAYGILIKCLPILSEVLSEVEDQEKQRAITEALQSALDAMEEDDITLLADILQYELIEELEEI